mmetsp:Transcript_66010/g.154482  ORF Transcript_66010/g.154482 Transcript_66010/m.154482 type:complete len:253 (+) Transcript_66010:129-887(+)
MGRGPVAAPHVQRSRLVDVEQDRQGLRARPGVHQGSCMGQPPKKTFSISVLAPHLVRVVALCGLHTEDDLGLARVRCPCILQCQVNLLAPTLADSCVQAPQPGPLYRKLPSVEGDKQLAQRSPESDHCADVPAQTVGLHGDHAKEAGFDAFTHGTGRVDDLLGGKVLALILAIHSLKPCQTQAEEGQRGENSTCKVLRHGQCTKDHTLAPPPWNLTKDAVLIHQPTLSRNSPEREAGQAKSCRDSPQEYHKD